MLKQDYFVNIDTEEKAYWLGFLSADGYAGGRYVEINLSECDRSHLESFRDAIGSTKTIYSKPAKKYTSNGAEISSGPLAYCSIGCAVMARSLQQYGLYGNKTHTIRPWVAPSLKLQRAYYRGAFDGDGTINTSTKTKGNRIRWQMGFCGNRFMVEGFRDFCLANIEQTPWSNASKKLTPVGKVFVILFAGTHYPRQVAELLYKNCTVALPRKLLLANELMATVKPYRPMTPERMKEAFARLGNSTAVAAEFGLSQSMVNIYRQRFGLLPVKKRTT